MRGILTMADPQEPNLEKLKGYLDSGALLMDHEGKLYTRVVYTTKVTPRGDLRQLIARIERQQKRIEKLEAELLTANRRAWMVKSAIQNALKNADGHYLTAESMYGLELAADWHGGAKIEAVVTPEESAGDD